MSNTSQISASSSSDFSDNLNNPKKIFFSYAARISPVNFTLLLDYFASKSKDVFYYCEPQDNISFLSFELLGKKKFGFGEYNILSEEILKLKSKLISNHSDFNQFNLPIFVTSIKFPARKNSEEWNEFGDIDLIIPKIILFQHADSSFLIANFFSESFSLEQNFNEFLEREVELIYNLESRLNESIADKTILKNLLDQNDFTKWSEQIAQVITEIKKENIEKVVVARKVEYQIESDINWKKIIDELNEKYPSCANFLYRSGKSIFFGSTPEILIKFSGKSFFTEALAGSIRRGVDKTEDQLLENELLNSEKNKNEHQGVIDYIKQSLEEFVENIEVFKNPVIKKLQNIQHLQTTVTGTLKSEKDMFKVISSIFPTPAVCGIPKNKSLIMIEKSEDFDRGLFSGVLGWFNADNYGEFFVTIRSALINDNKLNAYAGCGIVEGSEAAEEFEESKLKLKPILSLFENAN